MHEVSFEVRYEIGKEVYLRTDLEGFPHIVMGYIVRPGGVVSYILESHGSEIEVEQFQIIPTKRLDGIEYN